MLSSDASQVDLWRQFRAELDAATPEAQQGLLADRARRARRTIIQMIASAGQGHIGGDLSVIDILTYLFSARLSVDPTRPDWSDRDRLVLSKGHCAAALYTSLAMSGFFAPHELSTFMAPDSALNGHPNRLKVPGVEANSGPLGHGLPIAVGIATAAKVKDKDWATVVVLGDGELQEGSNWEALMTAGHRGLDNLWVVVDRNRLQQGARTEETNRLDPLADRFAAFGCEVREIDGHDFADLARAFGPAGGGRPVAVIANTTKAKGVSFMEDRAEWHHKVPTPEQVTAALGELA